MICPFQTACCLICFLQLGNLFYVGIGLLVSCRSKIRPAEGWYLGGIGLRTKYNHAFAYHGSSLFTCGEKRHYPSTDRLFNTDSCLSAQSNGESEVEETRNLSSCISVFKESIANCFEKSQGRGQLIELKDVNIWLEDRVLFENVGFRVNKGECVGIVGNNGNGKTSLMEAVYQRLADIDSQSNKLSISMDIKYQGSDASWDRSTLYTYQLLQYMKLRGYALKELESIPVATILRSDDYLNFLDKENAFKEYRDVCSGVAYMRQNYVTSLDGTITVKEAITERIRIHHIRLELINYIEDSLDGLHQLANYSVSEGFSQEPNSQHSTSATNADWAQKILDLYRNENSRVRQKSKNADMVTNVLLDMFGMRDLLDCKIEELSGGFKMRQYLMCSLLNGPQLLLLDEPTNNLDYASVSFLSKTLKRLIEVEGLSVIVISHDHSFLNSICNVILQVPGDGSLSRFTGNFDRFVEQGAKNLQSREAKLHKLKTNLNKLKQQYQATVESTKGSDKQRRILLSQKRKLIEETEEDIETLKGGEKNAYSEAYEKAVLLKTAPMNTRRLSYLPLVQRGIYIRQETPAFTLRNVTIGNKSREVLLHKVSLKIYYGDRILILGNNGAGKSTLLSLLDYTAQAASLGTDVRTMTNSHSYLELLNGDCIGDKKSKVNYFTQNCSDLLKSQLTIADLAMKFADIDQTQIQQLTEYLATFHLKEFMDVSVRTLSFGERSRLMLALQFLRDSTFLFLDEPTNHLDLYMQGILPQLLNDVYAKGGMLIATHDLHLMRNLEHITGVLYIHDPERIYVYNGAFKEAYTHFKEEMPQASHEEMTAFLEGCIERYRRSCSIPQMHSSMMESSLIVPKKKKRPNTGARPVTKPCKTKIKNARRFS